MNIDHDVVIVGGGLVGTTLAFALAEQSIDVALIDAKQRPEEISSLDQRALALTLASHRIYQSLNIWSFIKPHTTPIKSIHVSESGRFGQTHFQAEEYDLSAFGYVIQAGKLQAVLDEVVKNKPTISLICPAHIKQVQFAKESVLLIVETEKGIKQLNTRLVVAADGTHSRIRKLLNIQTEHWDYKQSALVAQVQLKNPNQLSAYERFKQNNVIAALPLENDKSVMIWTLEKAQAEEMKFLTDEELLQSLQQAFGHRLGRFEHLIHYEIHPLHGLLAKEQCRQNVVLIGNAAHTLHPIAAQGFNLGLRDVAVFTEFLLKNRKQIHQLDWLVAYEQHRQRDQELTIFATNQLLKLFQSRSLFFQLTRNLMMSALDFVPIAKRKLAEKAMGLTHIYSKMIVG